MEDLTGKQFGHYEIVAPIGEGGMAAVYKAYHPAMERYVAVKVLPRQMASSPEFLARFQREARLVAHLQHPNILPVFDFGESDGYTYVVMPFMPNGTLADMITSRRLTMGEIRKIMTQLCDALAYAHSIGMIHRDLKPSNVLMDTRGNCLLTDFGLARMVEATSKLTSSGTIMGTPAYMSPEQGMGEAIDQRSDLYSLGIIFYEMVTGRVPYTAETPLAILFKHVQDPLPSARTLNPDLSEEIELVLLKALAKNRDDRYQNAQEMLVAIQAAMRDPAPQPIPVYEAPPVSIMERSGSVPPPIPPISQPLPAQGQSAPRPNNNLWIIIGIFLLAIVLGLGWAWLRSQSGPATVASLQPTDPPPTLYFTQPPPTQTPNHPTATSSVSVPKAISNRNWIVYGIGNGQDSTDNDPRYIAMLNIQTSQERRLTLADGGDNFPTFSPDGTEIVFTGCKNFECRLYILNLASGKVEKIEGIDLKAMFPDWCSVDANQLVFEGRNTQDDRAIYLFSRSTNKVTQLTDGPSDSNPGWSPDCSKVVFKRSFGLQGDIYVVDIKTGKPSAVVVNASDDGQPAWAPDGRTLIFTRVSEDTNGDGNVNNDDRLDLYQINANGGNEKVLIGGRYSVFSPAFSPDGSQVVFCDFNYETDLQQIMIYSILNGSITTLTAPGPYYHTNWSP